MPATKIQDKTEVLRWFREKRTYLWMVEQYKTKYNITTTEPMWAAFRRREGIDRRNTRSDNLLPWKLKEEHRHLYPAMMLRTEGRLRAGKTVAETKAKKLASWKQSLEQDNLVVHYDPDTEEGFFYVPREQQDTDLIREPKEKTGNQARD
ncbi:hypothetical protein HRW13_20545 [Streptomyces lunaelactis]|uniref:hypothetical protein n=1 Tax=Streptomyces lunaelactis TaxID=1535768 RepID=UPI001585CCE2|nr:hypothetical protein [Streptomyces lunaelactis]NUK43204.1 hypothetical protein [Streptomyces lunaelactis]